MDPMVEVGQLKFHVILQTTPKQCFKLRAAHAACLFFFIHPIRSLFCGASASVVDAKTTSFVFAEGGNEYFKSRPMRNFRGVNPSHRERHLCDPLSLPQLPEL